MSGEYARVAGSEVRIGPAQQNEAQRSAKSAFVLAQGRSEVSHGYKGWSLCGTRGWIDRLVGADHGCIVNEAGMRTRPSNHTFAAGSTPGTFSSMPGDEHPGCNYKTGLCGEGRRTEAWGVKSPTGERSSNALREISGITDATPRPSEASGWLPLPSSNNSNHTVTLRDDNSNRVRGSVRMGRSQTAALPRAKTKREPYANRH